MDFGMRTSLDQPINLQPLTTSAPIKSHNNGKGRSTKAQILPQKLVKNLKMITPIIHNLQMKKISWLKSQIIGNDVEFDYSFGKEDSLMLIILPLAGLFATSKIISLTGWFPFMGTLTLLIVTWDSG
ncbi:hypothetical protein AB3S75_000392 [Citrus x aurantiifolia]